MKWFIALLAVVFLAGCGATDRDEWHPVTLADYNFRGGQPDTAFGRTFGQDHGIHWFETGWTRLPDENGVWSIGDESVLHLFLLGRNCRLRVTCSTTPELARGGQTMTIGINGLDVGEFPLADQWSEVECDVALPDSLILQGYNLVSFRASTVHEPNADNQDQRPLAIYFRDLRVQAELGSRQLDTWQEMTALGILPGDWQTTTWEEAGRPGESRPDAGAGLPDVLILLLDAAVADHFSCYGYARPTTPAIDALASAGLQFDAVFSSAPFTLTAVPSLLTGMPWRDHRVIQKGEALDAGFSTLAEVLQAAGYLTLGYSDNPFVSLATQAEQGFDEFNEVWKHPRHGKPGDNPELIENMLQIRAQKGFGDQPVFAYLHLMPPHSPYLPGEEHDLWCDPAYAGAIDGSATIINDIVEGRRSVDEADHERLVALYDGNLHRIDASVGRIVDQWQALERDRDLLVIVVSDHGEAFGQHGYYEHLTTVYDEMLHVPLILWPAAQWDHLAGDTDGLYAIADVMPVLLNKLEVSPLSGTVLTGRFIEVLANPTRERAEIASRTTVHANRFGLRTERYLAIYDCFGEQELYDLSRDPMARDNLRLREPDRYRELIARLRAILMHREGSGESVRGELSDEDMETLRSLGY
ncbi:MAG: sulfatase [bacterium]